MLLHFQCRCSLLFFFMLHNKTAIQFCAFCYFFCAMINFSRKYVSACYKKSQSIHTMKHLTLPLGGQQQQPCISRVITFFLHTNLKFQLKIKLNIIFSSPVKCYIYVCCFFICFCVFYIFFL